MDISKLTPLEIAWLDAAGFASNAAINDLVQDLVERSVVLEKEKKALDWRNNLNHRRKVIKLISESRDINGALALIAAVNYEQFGIEA